MIGAGVARLLHELCHSFRAASTIPGKRTTGVTGRLLHRSPQGKTISTEDICTFFGGGLPFLHFAGNFCSGPRINLQDGDASGKKVAEDRRRPYLSDKEYVCCKCWSDDDQRLYKGALYSRDCPVHGQTWHRLVHLDQRGGSEKAAAQSAATASSNHSADQNVA